MRVLLAPHGTRGDVQPMLALAHGLRARGHHAAFLVPDNFVAWIRGYGFACEPDGVDVEAALRSHGGDFSSLRWQMHHFTKVLVPSMFESFMRIDVDADLIVGAGVQVAGASVAEWKEIPYVSAAFCPCAVPSSAMPPPTVRSQGLPRWMNRLLWDIGVPLGGLMLRGSINAGRKRLGLEPVANPLAELGRQSVIVAADRDLAPLADDVPSRVVATDAWTLDEPEPHVAAEVEAFLDREPSPIYVGFGSMVARQAGTLVTQVIDVARALGRRVIVAGGWAGLERYVMDADDVLAVGAVPHDIVLPHVAAVVHHGGAGTTHAAARAGVPQIVLPHLLDQFYWARRVEQLELGPRGLPVDLVTADILAERMARALEDRSIHERARALGSMMEGRNGVAAAVHHLELLTAAAAPAAG
jgi:UDP:flavonoid glycosyltransferase YjiC (YdhE family)